MSETTNEQYHTLPTTYNEHGQPTATAMFTPTADGKRCEMIVKTKVIPVLFVPGIMGSNLNYVDKNGNTKEAWGPPNNFGTKVGQLVSYSLFASAADRAEALSPDTTSVKWDGSVNAVPNAHGDAGSADDDDKLNGKALAKKRGWGTVHKDSYGEFLVQLQTILDQPRFDANEATWSAITKMVTPPGADPLTAEELNHAHDFHFPVYACGYNWTQSNRKSATGYDSGPDAGKSALTDRVDAILKEVQDKLDCTCTQVILVTHSMGGLVARAYAQANPDKILGIVYGVMPATGAPATYKRVRSGFGGEGGGIDGWGASKILGKNAELAAPPVLNSEGALQLLPWPNYGENTGSLPQQGTPLTQWLQVRRTGEVTPLLTPSRDEVLSGDAWYSLLPADKSNEYEGEDSKVNRNRRITPSDTRAMAIRKARGITEKPEDDRIALEGRIKRVTLFQAQYATSYLKGKTYAFYGDDPAQRSWWAHVWEGAIPQGVTDADLRAATLKKDDGQGQLLITLQDGRDLTLTIAPASQPGDGTVPTPSGMAPQAEGVPCFIQTGYDHQHAYVADNQLGLHTALYGIVKFAQQRDS